MTRTYYVIARIPYDGANFATDGPKKRRLEFIARHSNRDDFYAPRTQALDCDDFYRDKYSCEKACHDVQRREENKYYQVFAYKVITDMGE